MKELLISRVVYKFFIATIVFCLMAFFAVGQINFSGIVKDSTSNQPLSFVNIGIRHTTTGTRSSKDGSFILNIPQQYKNDTITFSMMGYNEMQFSINEIEKHRLVQLKVSTIKLPDVNIIANRLVEKQFGIARHKSLLHFTDGIVENNNFLEIAQVMRLDNTLSKITSANLFINSSNNDSATFRVNFYGFDGHRPTKQIVNKNIIQTLPVKAGWLSFDLTSYDIYLKGDVVVSVELIPTKSKPERINYEIKLGGSSHSFFKTSSLGDWTVPPHHFRFFVTALVEESRKKRSDESDENETQATMRMYSESVKDSFSIFVHLPRKYIQNKIKRYPTIYLLDANAYQDIVISSVELLRKKRRIPDAILVGIGYKNVSMLDSLRNRDYTFPKAMPLDSFPISGGAEKFLNFVEKELLPNIDELYKTDITSRTIMGHSFGGYFTLFAFNRDLLQGKSVFKNYVAASPSLDYSDEYIVKQFKTMAIPTANISPHSLFLAMGENEAQENTGTSFDSFVLTLDQLKLNHTTIKAKVFPKLSHMETAVPTFEEGLQYIFIENK